MNFTINLGRNKQSVKIYNDKKIELEFIERAPSCLIIEGCNNDDVNEINSYCANHDLSNAGVFINNCEFNELPSGITNSKDLRGLTIMSSALSSWKGIHKLKKLE